MPPRDVSVDRVGQDGSPVDSCKNRLLLNGRAYGRRTLAERVINPRNQASQLRGFKDAYKIKLRSAGYRLVYEVNDYEITIFVIAVGKREKGLIYTKAEQRK